MPEQKNRIAEIRRKRGLTQEELAEQLGISSRTLSNMEAGRHDAELINKAVKLCDFLQCDWKDLCEEAPQARGEVDESRTRFRFKGKKIAELRKKRGFITQLELALQLKVREATVADWENEKHNADSWRKLIRLCEVLRCSFAEFLPVALPSPPIIPPATELEPIEPTTSSAKLEGTELEEKNSEVKK